MKKNVQHQHPLEESFQETIIKNFNKDPGAVAVVAAFIPSFPGNTTGMRKGISKVACAYSKTTNLTTPILSELNQELEEVRVAVLQNHVTADYLLLTERMGCKQFPGMCCFNLSDFFQVIQIQL